MACLLYWGRFDALLSRVETSTRQPWALERDQGIAAVVEERSLRL